MFSIWMQLTDVSKRPSLKASSGGFRKKGWPVQAASATGIEITPSSKSAFARSQADTFLQQMNRSWCSLRSHDDVLLEPETMKPLV